VSVSARSKDYEVVFRIFDAMHSIGSAAVPGLLACAGDRDPAVAIDALRWVEAYPTEADRILPVLTNCLASSDPLLRQAAAAGIQHMKAERRSRDERGIWNMNVEH
jgi:hypothetical protein